MHSKLWFKKMFLKFLFSYFFYKGTTFVLKFQLELMETAGNHQREINISEMSLELNVNYPEDSQFNRYFRDVSFSLILAVSTWNAGTKLDSLVSPRCSKLHWTLQLVGATWELEVCLLYNETVFLYIFVDSRLNYA